MCLSSGAAAANGGGGGAADPSTSWWTRFSPRAATAEEGGGGGGWWGFSPRYAQVRQSLASFARSLAADHGCPCAVAAPECPPGGCGAQPLRLDWRRISDGGGSPSLAVGELLRDCAPPLCANIVISQKCSSLRGSVEPERSPFRDRWAFCAGDTGSCSHSSATTFQVAAPHSAFSAERVCPCLAPAAARVSPPQLPVEPSSSTPPRTRRTLPLALHHHRRHPPPRQPLLRPQMRRRGLSGRRSSLGRRGRGWLACAPPD